MANNIVSKLVIDTEATLGTLLAVETPRPYEGYKEGTKTGPEGLTFPCLSTGLNYEKISVKVASILTPPFTYSGNPIPITFDGLECKVWQDFSNKGEIKLSVTARSFRLAEEKSRLKINGGSKE